VPKIKNRGYESPGNEEDPSFHETKDEKKTNKRRNPKNQEQV
jgi:hypothetical protein